MQSCSEFRLYNFYFTHLNSFFFFTICTTLKRSFNTLFIIYDDFFFFQIFWLNYLSNLDVYWRINQWNFFPLWCETSVEEWTVWLVVNAPYIRFNLSPHNAEAKIRRCYLCNAPLCHTGVTPLNSCWKEIYSSSRARWFLTHPTPATPTPAVSALGVVITSSPLVYTLSICSVEGTN